MTLEAIGAFGMLAFVIMCFGYIIGYGACAEKKNKEIEILKQILNQNAS